MDVQVELAKRDAKIAERIDGLSSENNHLKTKAVDLDNLPQGLVLATDLNDFIFGRIQVGDCGDIFICLNEVDYITPTHYIEQKDLIKVLGLEQLTKGIK